MCMCVLGCMCVHVYPMPYPSHHTITTPISSHYYHAHHTIATPITPYHCHAHLITLLPRPSHHTIATPISPHPHRLKSSDHRRQIRPAFRQKPSAGHLKMLHNRQNVSSEFSASPDAPANAESPQTTALDPNLYSTYMCKYIATHDGCRYVCHMMGVGMYVT